MYKQKNGWSRMRSATNSQQDSGSESAPLLSSGSHASVDPVMFEDSETSDLESSPMGSYTKYGSVGVGSFNSAITVLPKRLPPIARDNKTALTTPGVSPSNFQTDKCYEIHNYDLLLGEERYNANLQPALAEFTGGFLPRPLSLLRTNSDVNLIKDGRPKQSSLVTIFSVWNTVLGSSLLTMPWGIGMAGFFPGIILVLAISGLCLYTAYRLLEAHRYYGGGDRIEVIELCRVFLGRWAELVAQIFSVTVLFGAIIAYWILMSNFLYNSVNFFYDVIAGYPLYPRISNDSLPLEVLCPRENIYNESDVSTHELSYDNLGPAWDLYKTVPIFLAIIIFPLLNFNSATFFTKFNSFGTIAIVYLMIFILLKSISWGINMSEEDWEISWVLKPTFLALSGMLSLSFFIHNIIITIMHSNRDQTKNGRDLTIAYVLVTITYVLVGITFFLCFPLAKSCIEDNLLNNFPKWDGLTLGARIVLLFQLLTVYPLVTYMLRTQLLSSILKVSDTNRLCVIFVNSIIVSICVLFAIFVPHIGTVIRYTGAISGLVYVFTLPSLLHLAILRKRGQLTLLTSLIHLSIPVIGGFNLIGQFFVNDH